MTLPARDERPEPLGGRHDDTRAGVHWERALDPDRAARWRQAAEEVRAMLRDPERAHQRPPGRS
jgi:hypothetical protein